jgi:hypothetical protein
MAFTRYKRKEKMYDYHSKGGLGSGTGIRGYYEVLRSATKCHKGKWIGDW